MDAFNLINLLTLLVISTVVFTSNIILLQAAKLAKRHSSGSIIDHNEENIVGIPSSLCNGELYPLGMESGEIADMQITASSSYNVQSVGPQNARLNREISGGAWCPLQQLSATYSGNEWIQVDLGSPYVITAIATQGRFGNGMGVEFAEEYWIEYSRDNGTTWNKWTDMNGDYKLPGNYDTYTPRRNILAHPLVAISLLRIVPFANYQRTTCLRFELYGCRHDYTLPITYTIPDGYKGSSLGDLRDLTYDGRTDFYGYLNGGLGQLTDGIKGNDNYKVNYGYEWIGWRAKDSELAMVFEFGQIVNFTSATFYCHNLFSKDIQVFAAAKVWFSYDGTIWSKRPIEFEYMPDLVLENARDVVIHLHNKAAMFVKFDFQFANEWILISEVTFNTNPVDENFTATYEQLDYGLYDENNSLLPFTTTQMNNERTLLPPTAFFIIFALLLTIICTVVVLLLRIHLKRKEKSGHIVVCMKDLATTPLYCEPKDFSSTSSTISNTIADPEYAVPDVALANGNAGNKNTTISTTLAAGGVNSGSGGHLNNNFQMFGSSFTRIFMGNIKPANVNENGSLNNKTSSVNNSAATNNIAHPATGSGANITANIVYSSQKFNNDTATNNVHNYNVNNIKSLSNNFNSMNQIKTISNGGGFAQRQYYLSGDLLPKSSPKLSQKNSASNDQLMTNGKMTSNTIYNKRKYGANNVPVNDDSITTHSQTLKLKYSSNGMGQNEYIEDMKCIPEIMEKDLEIVHKQFGCSQYGKIMLGQFSTSQIMSNYIHGAVNDLSPETEHCASGMSIGNNNNNLDDKKHFSNNGGNGRLVVVKTLQNDKLRSDFLHEMKSKWFISAKSERVAKLIGFLSGTNFTAMVVECGDCDLAHFLCNCDKKSIGIQTLLHIGSEVASGMKYLESLGYVHRDLSARNCLIYTGSLRVKITDFAAYLTTNATEYCNGIALRWIAPEALINGAYTSKSDVYSFGVTLWEILTYALIRPHHELDDDSFLQKLFTAYECYINDLNNDCSSSSVYYQATYGSRYANNGDATEELSNQNNNNNNHNNNNTANNKRGHQGTTKISYRLALPRPTTCPSEIYDLMLECWQLNEQIRPSFRDITQFLIARNHSICSNNANLEQPQTQMHTVQPITATILSA